jgi:hypothetical protein
MHTALWCLTGFSLLGAAVAAVRPRHRPGGEAAADVPAAAGAAAL